MKTNHFALRDGNLRNKERISQQREEIERLKKLASERFYHIESIQRNLADERREVESLKNAFTFEVGVSVNFKQRIAELEGALKTIQTNYNLPHLTDDDIQGIIYKALQ